METTAKLDVSTRVEVDDEGYESPSTSVSQKKGSTFDRKDMDRMGKKQEMNVYFSLRSYRQLGVLNCESSRIAG